MMLYDTRHVYVTKIHKSKHVYKEKSTPKYTELKNKPKYTQLREASQRQIMIHKSQKLMSQIN